MRPISYRRPIRVYPYKTPKKCPIRVGFGVMRRTISPDHPNETDGRPQREDRVYQGQYPGAEYDPAGSHDERLGR